MEQQDTLLGFGNHHSSSAIEGALPLLQNSPQRPPHGLYAEQINGSAFTQPRHHNLRSWVYRLLPSAAHPAFQPLSIPNFSHKNIQTVATPNRLRWHAPTIDQAPHDLIQGLRMLLNAGSANSKQGVGVYQFTANQSMRDRYFYSIDGEWLGVLYSGSLLAKTEFGNLEVNTGEIFVIPRGVKFSIELLSPSVQGYIAENYAAPFKLPDLGLVGSNGLANPRHFYYPSATFEDTNQSCELICKYQHQLWHTELDHSPLNVVAWHGNLAPYKYTLSDFNPLNSVSFDHPDPSIFTVLTSPSAVPGLANCDFVIFPPRWMVAENTFRPPFFHRNTMSEFMALISGQYDAKDERFKPGSASYHHCMMAHGPDLSSYNTGTNATLKPEKIENSLAFMFETVIPMEPTAYALGCEHLEENYDSCWGGFTPARIKKG